MPQYVLTLRHDSAAASFQQLDPAEPEVPA